MRVAYRWLIAIAFTIAAFLAVWIVTDAAGAEVDVALSLAGLAATVVALPSLHGHQRSAAQKPGHKWLRPKRHLAVRSVPPPGQFSRSKATFVTTSHRQNKQRPRR
jgi:hypothetical protein